MKIAVHGKEFNRGSAPFIARIFEILAHSKADILVSSEFGKCLKTYAKPAHEYSV